MDEDRHTVSYSELENETIADLKQKYDLDEPVNRRVYSTWSRYAVPQLRAQAKKDKLSVDRYRQRIWLAHRIVLGLDLAVRPSVDEYQEAAGSFTWTHQRLERWSYMTAGTPRRGIQIDRESLMDAAAEYLAQPELRTDFLDWVFIDSLLYGELDSFMKQVVSGGIFGSINWAYLLADGGEMRYYSLRLLFGVLGFCMRYLLLPAITVWLLVTNQLSAALWTGGAFVLYLLYRALTMPARISLWRNRKKAFMLLEQMHNAYMLAEPPVLNPTRLKAAVDEATAKGVAFPTPALSLVDRLVTINPTVSLPFSTESEPPPGVRL